MRWCVDEADGCELCRHRVDRVDAANSSCGHTRRSFGAPCTLPVTWRRLPATATRSGFGVAAGETPHYPPTSGKATRGVGGDRRALAWLTPVGFVLTAVWGNM